MYSEHLAALPAGEVDKSEPQLVDGREPQRLTHGHDRPEAAAGANDAVIVGDLVSAVGKHGLDGRCLLPLKALTKAPAPLVCT